MSEPDSGTWKPAVENPPMSLNQRAWLACDECLVDPAAYGVAVHRVQGATVVDAGIGCSGGLSAGLMLARICTADLMQIDIVPGAVKAMALPVVAVHTARPVEACMASQYAGWRISVDDYFAMGSGPMRAAAATEALFETIGGTEEPSCAVGVLETSSLPTAAVVGRITEACGVEAESLRLLVAPTASIAGGVQVVARSVETALHKLHEMDFDLHRIVAGYGSAPVPPVAKDDMAAIGRTNDAVLYGASCTLYVRGDDPSVEAVVERLPASFSSDYGAPFAEIFARYDHDFYKIDPHLFSPAAVTMQNVETGTSWHAGRFDHEILLASFTG